MSDIRLISNAAKEKAVATLLVAGTWAQGDTITLTIGTVTVTITIGTLITTAQVATTVKQAWEGDTLTDSAAIISPTTGIPNIGQFSKITATVNSSTVTFTADAGGKPFTMSAGETAAAGTITFTAEATAATGPYHADKADNYSGDALPVTGDHLIIDTGDVDLLHGLSLGVQLLTLTKYKSYTGKIGLPNVNRDNTSLPFTEYRTPKALTQADDSIITTYNLEVGDGQGSSRQRYDAGAGNAIWNVYGAGGREDTAVPTTLLAGTDAANELNNFNGDVGFAFYIDEEGTLAKLKNGNGSLTSAKTYCGAGADLTACEIEVNGGTLTTNSAISTSSGGITIHSGEHYHYGGNIGDLLIEGGTFHLRTPADVTFAGTVRVFGTGRLNLSDYQHQATFTENVQLYDQATFDDPNGSCALNTDFDLFSSKIKLNLGPNRTLRRTA
jgi:hypothetical protein